MVMTADIDPRSEVVLGVDTHLEQHTAVAVDGLGRVLGTIEVPTTRRGFRRLLCWARTFGQFKRAGVEGCGAYGATLARFLIAEGVEVIEVDRPNRQMRRRRGKSDPTDAEAAARAVLSGEASGVPKDTTGIVETIRVLQVTRRSAVKARVQTSNQMKDLILVAPEPLRNQLRGLTVKQRVKLCRSWRPSQVDDPHSAIRRALRDLARRWQALQHEIDAFDKDLDRLLWSLVPNLMNQAGVGIDSAAKLVIAAGQNPERLRNEAAFAALCGTSPVEASSGKHTAHRLNRGGNRHANQALHTVALVRSQRCPETRRYIEKRRAEGKTDRHIRRCLKRALARRFHRIILQDLANWT